MPLSSLLRKELHESLPLCNWMGPWVATPLKERGYRGDDSIESMLYSLATGDRKDPQELDQGAERIFLLHRALTIRDMGTITMRARHDTIPSWVYADKSGKAPFTLGTPSMDIVQTTTSTCRIFLCSTLHPEREHASMLAEWLDMGQFENP
jgi:aldehyde:ferredoxin oxidoreductase